MPRRSCRGICQPTRHRLRMFHKIYHCKTAHTCSSTSGCPSFRCMCHRACKEHSRTGAWPRLHMLCLHNLASTCTRICLPSPCHQCWISNRHTFRHAGTGVKRTRPHQHTREACNSPKSCPRMESVRQCRPCSRLLPSICEPLVCPSTPRHISLSNSNLRSRKSSVVERQVSGDIRLLYTTISAGHAGR